MDENRKTLWFVLTAVVLLALAVIVTPKRITPEAFIGQGQAFFPDFEDPNEATTLEVVEYDQETGEAVPFKVTFENGKWTIPSHYNYPADGAERLANTAAAMIQIKKDDYRSSIITDHEQFSVIDPLSDDVSLKGKGQRITIKGRGGAVLADLIIGREVEKKNGFKYVRSPEQSRVYAARTEIEVSTKFEDWIESDLLKVTTEKIERVVINDYTINERTLSVERRDNLALSRGDNDLWSADNMRSTQKVDDVRMRELLNSLVELKIVDVRPKPQGLSQSLKSKSSDGKKISSQDRFSLQSKGFYFTAGGQLLSNEGEMLIYTDDGVKYTLRFGEIAGTEKSGGEESTIENRYLFVSAVFDSLSFPEPTKPSNDEWRTKADSLLTNSDTRNRQLANQRTIWQSEIDTGRKLSEELNNRFADWYYVISSESYDKLQMRREELVIKKSDGES
ncbi:MAG: DUF4340 domain-containing protein [candidate division Zixibacteria bacterium]